MYYNYSKYYNNSYEHVQVFWVLLQYTNILTIPVKYFALVWPHVTFRLKEPVLETAMCHETPVRWPSRTSSTLVSCLFLVLIIFVVLVIHEQNIFISYLPIIIWLLIIINIYVHRDFVLRDKFLKKLFFYFIFKVLHV